MKLLRFLRSLFSGQTYSQPQQPILTIASKNIACYRGQKYNVQKPRTSSQFRGSECPMSVTIFKYRGTSYMKPDYQFPEQNKKLVECPMSVTVFKYRGASYVKPDYQFSEQNKKLVYY